VVRVNQSSECREVKVTDKSPESSCDLQPRLTERLKISSYSQKATSKKDKIIYRKNYGATKHRIGYIGCIGHIGVQIMLLLMDMTQYKW